MVPTNLSADTLDYRLRAAGVPVWGREWSFQTFPQDIDAAQSRASLLTFEWAQHAGRDLPPGLVLWGPPGRGKTGLGLAALRLRIEAGDGSPFAWLTSAGYEIEQRIHEGLALREPAPLWFERWADLKGRLLEVRGTDEDGQGRTARSLLRGLDQTTDVLMLDDIDQDSLSVWKEEQLLYLVERPLRGKRVIFTVNADVGQVVDRLGPRIVDRFLDSHRYLLVALGTGPSLRR